MQLNPVNFHMTPSTTLLSPAKESGSGLSQRRAKVSMATERQLGSHGKTAHVGLCPVLSPGVHVSQSRLHVCSGASCTGTWALSAPPNLPQQVGLCTSAPRPSIFLGEWCPHKTSQQREVCKGSLDHTLESQGTRMVSGWSLNLSRGFR